MEKETHVASPEMKLFFEKLLSLKEYVKEQDMATLDSPGYCDANARHIISTIYERLDAIIKEKK